MSSHLIWHNCEYTQEESQRKKIICNSQAQICRKPVSPSACETPLARTAKFLTLSQLRTELGFMPAISIAL